MTAVQRERPRGGTSEEPGPGELDQALADRVGDRVGPVAQLQARRDVVDDVLDGPLRVEQPVARPRPCRTRRRAAGRTAASRSVSPENVSPRGDSTWRWSWPTWRSSRPSRSGGSVPSPAAAERSAAARLPAVASVRRSTPVDAGLGRGQQAPVVDARHQQHDPAHAPAAQRAHRRRATSASSSSATTSATDVLRQLALGDHDREPLRAPQLAGDAGPGQRVGGRTRRPGSGLERHRLGDHRISSTSRSRA